MIVQTRCKGHDCPMKLYCHRYEKGPVKEFSKSFSQYFISPPFKIINDNFLCDNYIGDTSKLPIGKVLDKM